MVLSVVLTELTTVVVVVTDVVKVPVGANTVVELPLAFTSALEPMVALVVLLSTDTPTEAPTATAPPPLTLPAIMPTLVFSVADTWKLPPAVASR